jgi:hypothetical protein
VCKRTDGMNFLHYATNLLSSKAHEVPHRFTVSPNGAQIGPSVLPICIGICRWTTDR